MKFLIQTVTEHWLLTVIATIVLIFMVIDRIFKKPKLGGRYSGDDERSDYDGDDYPPSDSL